MGSLGIKSCLTQRGKLLNLKVWFLLPFCNLLVVVWGFIFVLNESFVASATKSIMEARTRLVIFAPASSSQDRDRPAGYTLP